MGKCVVVVARKNAWEIHPTGLGGYMIIRKYDTAIEKSVPLIEPGPPYRQKEGGANKKIKQICLDMIYNSAV